MGWIAAKVYNFQYGPMYAPSEVKEAAGFVGERVTPKGSLTNFTIPLKGRTVWATRDEALNAEAEADAVARGEEVVNGQTA